MTASLSYNGTSDKCVTTTAVVTGYPCTICVWEKPDSIAVANGVVAASRSDVDNLQRFLITSLGTTGALRVAVADATTPTNCDTSNFLTALAWNHCAGIYTSATSRKAIVNGDLVNANTNATSRTPSGINRFSLGVSEDSAPAGFYAGIIGQVAVWNVALTDEEVVALARGWSPLRIRRTALVWFNAFPGTGSTVQDIIAGNNLTKTGTTVSADGPPVSLS